MVRKVFKLVPMWRRDVGMAMTRAFVRLMMLLAVVALAGVGAGPLKLFDQIRTGDSVTAVDNQATNVFFIEGSSSPSVVPYNPGWTP